jgi:hypothetical protein
VGRGTLASGHPSFPLLIVAVPVLSAERFFLIAFAALHPEWGNNLNLSSAALYQPSSGSQRFSFMQMLFQFASQSASAFQIDTKHR